MYLSFLGRVQDSIIGNYESGKKTSNGEWFNSRKQKNSLTKGKKDVKIEAKF